jgi:hypothetical protein
MVSAVVAIKLSPLKIRTMENSRIIYTTARAKIIIHVLNFARSSSAGVCVWMGIMARSVCVFYGANLSNNIK